MEYSEHDLTIGKLRLNKCDIYKVLANGATLFGSQGAEYDVHDVDGIVIISLLATQHIIVIITIIICITDEILQSRDYINGEPLLGRVLFK